MVVPLLSMFSSAVGKSKCSYAFSEMSYSYDVPNYRDFWRPKQNFTGHRDCFGKPGTKGIPAITGSLEPVWLADIIRLFSDSPR